MPLPHRLSRPVRLGLYALAVAILFVLCILPTRELPPVQAGDRVEHTIAWLVLTVTGYALAPHRRLAIPAFALAYGVFIEIAQGLAPTGRHADIGDFGADALGVALGVGLFLIVRWTAPRLVDAA